MNEARFTAMCRQHDLTYMYADDSRAWRAGCSSIAQIYIAARELPDGVAKRIWNDVVDEKVAPNDAPKYYWEV